MNDLFNRLIAMLCVMTFFLIIIWVTLVDMNSAIRTQAPVPTPMVIYVDRPLLVPYPAPVKDQP